MKFSWSSWYSNFHRCSIRANKDYYSNSVIITKLVILLRIDIYFQRNFRKICSRRKERKKRYNAEARVTIYYLSNVSTTRQISRVSRAIVGRRSPSHNGRGKDDIMIIILDVGNRPIRVMDGDFKTEGDPVIPGRPLCRQPNFPARLIPPVSKDAVEGKRKERKRKKTRWKKESNSKRRRDDRRATRRDLACRGYKSLYTSWIGRDIS